MTLGGATGNTAQLAGGDLAAVKLSDLIMADSSGLFAEEGVVSQSRDDG
ncbi:MAG: hypothetical protein R3C05_23835 [Pirellulaceae bacterium]